MNEDFFDDIFADDEQVSSELKNTFSESEEKWKVLIVDDEEDIHTVIKMALDGFIYKDRQIQFFDAFSGEEARSVLNDHKDISLILLDVVMETLHAGLEFVKHVRDDLHNDFIRIVLWTGQAGQAPMREAVQQYEINDYKSKTELTSDNIFTVVLASLRTYDSILTVEKYRLHLEEMVAERTRQLEEEKQIVTQQNKEITDSIHYAKRIQNAVIPPDDLITKAFSDYFIYNKPRDIVSGDFYWIGQNEDQLVIAAADCTGHGVPGAFMSILGVSFLNQILSSSDTLKSDILLNELRNKIIYALNQSGSGEETRDGMDIALIIKDKKSNTLQYSGANNPLFLIRSAENREKEENIAQWKDQLETSSHLLYVIKPDRMPVGIHSRHVESFNRVEFQLQKDDVLYLFSDGFIDQFGGATDKKFKSKPFKKLILSLQHEDLESQHAILDGTLNNWMGENFQVDDILIIGLKN